MKDGHKPLNLHPAEAARLLAIPARPVRGPRGGLSRETRQLLKPMAKRFGPDIADLQLAWVQVVGKSLGTLSKPQKITGTDADRTLWVEAAGPVALALEAQGNQLLDRLSRFAGHGRIVRIRCVKPRPQTKANPQAPSRPVLGLSPQELAQLEAQLAHLPEGSMKQALRNLGRGVFLRTRTNNPVSSD